MTGKESSNPPDGSGKKKIPSVDTAERSDLFGYDCLVTEYGILKENHETLNKDYKILEETFKLEKEVSEALKVNQQKETKELETKLERLGKDLAKEKGEKEVLKKEMERMKSKTAKEENELKKMKDKYVKSESEKEELKKKMEKIEIEKEVVINVNVLQKKIQELVNAKEKEEKKLKKMKNKCGKLAEKCESEKEVFKKEMERIETEKKAMIYELENKYLELGEKFVTVEKECSYVKSLYDAEMLTDLEGSNEALKKEVTEVDDHNVNNAITDLIVIMDESDTESDNAARNSNNVPQRPVDLKQEQQFDVPNSSIGNHLPSPPSSSSDEFVIKRGSYKRPRV